MNADRAARSQPVNAATSGLPYVDEHHIEIAAPRDAVWQALRTYVDTSLGLRATSPVALLLGTQPRSGFEIAHEVPFRELAMAGRHRFSRYVLLFELSDGSNEQTQLRAHTFAEFPGPHGFVYRTLVIRTRAHVVATLGILRTVRHRSVTTTARW